MQLIVQDRFGSLYSQACSAESMLEPDPKASVPQLARECGAKVCSDNSQSGCTVTLHQETFRTKWEES